MQEGENKMFEEERELDEETEEFLDDEDWWQ